MQNSGRGPVSGSGAVRRPSDVSHKHTQKERANWRPALYNPELSVVNLHTATERASVSFGLIKRGENKMVRSGRLSFTVAKMAFFVCFQTILVSLICAKTTVMLVTLSLCDWCLFFFFCKRQFKPGSSLSCCGTPPGCFIIILSGLKPDLEEAIKRWCQFPARGCWRLQTTPWGSEQCRTLICPFFLFLFFFFYPLEIWSVTLNSHRVQERRKCIGD